MFGFIKRWFFKKPDYSKMDLFDPRLPEYDDEGESGYYRDMDIDFDEIKKEAKKLGKKLKKRYSKNKKRERTKIYDKNNNDSLKSLENHLNKEL